MQQLTIYRILSFILVPVALLLGFMDVLMLFVSLVGNPTMLIIVFAIACWVIYVFTSLRFLLHGIANERICKNSLKDWIKVNAYGTLFIAGMFFINSSAVFFLNDLNLRQVLSEMMDQQPELSGKLTLDFFIQLFKIIAGIMFCISLITIVHVMMTFRLLKKYAHLFSVEA